MRKYDLTFASPKPKTFYMEESKDGVSFATSDYTGRTLHYGIYFNVHFTRKGRQSKRKLTSMLLSGMSMDEINEESYQNSRKR